VETTSRVIDEARRLTRAADGDPEIVALRLSVIERLKAADLIDECVSLKASIVEVASSVAYGLQLKKRQQYLRRRAQQAKTRARVAKHRARKTPTPKRAATAIGESLTARAMVTRQSHDAAGMFAHAALYQHFVRDCGYLLAAVQIRDRMDNFMMAVLVLFRLSQAGDSASFRRQRRLLVRSRPRLFGLIKDRPKR